MALLLPLPTWGGGLRAPQLRLHLLQLQLLLRGQLLQLLHPLVPRQHSHGATRSGSTQGGRSLAGHQPPGPLGTSAS